MGFIPISIDKYVELYLKSNSNSNKNELRKNLILALKDFKNGIKCSCGNDIWVIGSASVGNSCFTCITGESYPNDDYEIDVAIKKRENKKGQRHIDKIDKAKISGFFDDDGYEINTELVKKPSLCITCKNDEDPNEEIICNLIRFDHTTVRLLLKQNQLVRKILS